MDGRLIMDGRLDYGLIMDGWWMDYGCSGRKSEGGREYEDSALHTSPAEALSPRQPDGGVESGLKLSIAT